MSCPEIADTDIDSILSVVHKIHAEEAAAATPPLALLRLHSQLQQRWTALAKVRVAEFHLGEGRTPAAEAHLHAERLGVERELAAACQAAGADPGPATDPATSQPPGFCEALQQLHNARLVAEVLAGMLTVAHEVLLQSLAQPSDPFPPLGGGAESAAIAFGLHAALLDAVAAVVARRVVRREELQQEQTPEAEQIVVLIATPAKG